jgi:hypothetical protein
MTNYRDFEKKFEEEYNKREKENFTSLKNELWWFVRNCSEDNFHQPLKATDTLTDELLEIISKWNNININNNNNNNNNKICQNPNQKSQFQQ